MTRIVQRVTVLSVAVLLLLSQTHGQAPQTQPDIQPSFTADQHLIDELNIPSPIGLGDFFTLLQKKVPTFQYVAKPGDWQVFDIPPLHLRNVTVGQVFMLLGELDSGLEVTMVQPQSPNGEVIYVLKDRRPPPSPPPAEATRVTAFGIADVVDNLALRKLKEQDQPSKPEEARVLFAKDRKEALADVLSLLQAAISRGEGPMLPVPDALKLHNETEVLLVKGTSGQIAAVADALEALQRDLAQWRGKTFEPERKH